MSLRSIQFVRSVKLLTVRKEAFTARKWNSLSILRIFFGFAGEVREGLIVVSVRTVSTVRKYSLRHRKCGVRGFIHELFGSKTRTNEVRASEGF